MIAGVILCGGASRRMGQPKADIDFLGEPLLTRMIRIVRQVLEPIIVAAGPLQLLPQLPIETLVSRDVAALGGPIQALRSTFKQLSSDVTHMFVVGCDMPLLKAEVVRLFAVQARPETGAAAEIGGDIQSLPVLLPNVEAILTTKASSLKDYINELDVDPILESEIRKLDPELQSFRPMNTPQELAEAIRLASS